MKNGIGNSISLYLKSSPYNIKVIHQFISFSFLLLFYFYFYAHGCSHHHCSLSCLKCHYHLILSNNEIVIHLQNIRKTNIFLTILHCLIIFYFPFMSVRSMSLSFSEFKKKPPVKKPCLNKTIENPFSIVSKSNVFQISKLFSSTITFLRLIIS